MVGACSVFAGGCVLWPEGDPWVREGCAWAGLAPELVRTGGAAGVGTPASPPPFFLCSMRAFCSMRMAIVSRTWSSAPGEFILKPGVTTGETMPLAGLGVVGPVFAPGGAGRWDCAWP